MALSAKHFEAHASIINEVAYTEHMDLPTLTVFAGKLADYYAEENERFDRQRFFAACFKPQEVS